ncbi:P-loop containing nucleoside triphosphate hydrolase protein [Trametes sanguinea]|nr:P-loop containing nucleoside triphosphate hydrolase protein [Trametes sanguinea]
MSTSPFVPGRTGENLNGAPDHHQIVLILVGLIGSGKSTFAQALEQYCPEFVRCSQDDLGDRRSVEALARRSLREGRSVCIDRTNFDESQRATWINIAREHPRAEPWVIVFDTPYEICAARIAERTGHPTITSPELGMQVLQRFQSQYRPPAPHEGHARILYLKPSDCPDNRYSEADVREVLRRLRESPEVVQSAPHFAQGNGYNRGSPLARGGLRPRGRGDFFPRTYSRPDVRQTTLPWARENGGPSGESSGLNGPYDHAFSARRSDYQAREGNQDRTQDDWRR